MGKMQADKQHPVDISGSEPVLYERPSDFESSQDCLELQRVSFVDSHHSKVY